MKKPLNTFLALLFSLSSLCQTAAEFKGLTNTFISTLAQDQKKITLLPFTDTSRTLWTNLPVGLAARPGLQYGDLSAGSKVAFHRILTCLFSSQGYLKATSIMHLDDVLNLVYAQAYARNEMTKEVYDQIVSLQWAYEQYYISVWGNPELSEPWGLKFEGHHISINASVFEDEIRLAPMFLGSDPSEVLSTKYAGLRVLSKEEDYAFKLIKSMSEDQLAKVVLSRDVPLDIITNPSNPNRLLEYEGIRAGELSGPQLDLLRLLIMEYIGNLEVEKSREAMSGIEGPGIENVYFAWIGSLEPGKAHYYNINAPDFLIEYDNANRIGDANHIHTIWREKGKDFGEDLLKAHYENIRH